MDALFGIALMFAILAMIVRSAKQAALPTEPAAAADPVDPELQALARSQPSDWKLRAELQLWPALDGFVGLIEPDAVDLQQLSRKASGDDRLRREFENDLGIRRKPEPAAAQEWPAKEDFTGLIEPVSVNLQTLVRKRPGDSHLRRNAGMSPRTRRQTDPLKEFLAQLAK
jgi:hypothetical protein